MKYQVISRKYRPQRFDEVIGQTHICQTLQNAIRSGRIYHAYLFTGSRGIGKTSTARILAKTLNCLKPSEYNPCNECQNCREITDGRNIDVLEIDGASNRGIEQIRELRESVKYPPTNSKYRVFIIDEVHMLTKEAFNALLKTLEEPPEHAIFIFATTEPHKIPATIISRCQRYDFHRIPVKQIVILLRKIAEMESINISDDVLTLIAKKSDGSMRDAESLLDQVISFSTDNLEMEFVQKILGMIDFEYFFRISDAVLAHDSAALLLLSEEVFAGGIDLSEFLGEIAEHFRNLLILKTAGDVNMLDLPDVVKIRYQKEYESWNPGDLLRLLKILTEAQINLRTALNQRTHLEFTLLKMSKMDQTVTIDQLFSQLNALNIPAREINVQNPVKAEISLFDQPDTQNNPKPNVATTLSVKENQSVSLKTKTESVLNLKSELSLNIILQNWDQIINLLTAKSPSLSNFLMGGNPVSLKGNVLEIAFHETATFHKNLIQSRLKVLEDLFENFFKQTIKIKCIISNHNSKVIPDSKKLDDVAQKIIETFDGKVIN